MGAIGAGKRLQARSAAYREAQVKRNHDGIKCGMCKKRGADQRGPARRQRKPWPSMGEQWWVATFVCRHCGARQTLEVKG